VFVQGAVWNINPFDHRDELGKQLAVLLPELRDAAAVSSTMLRPGG
jgi:glucose-6-phosphate isomerase